MNKASTKPKGATSYKDTAFGIFPRSRLLDMELEGTKKGLDFIDELTSQNEKMEVTPELILKLHEVSFGWIFPNWAGRYRKVAVTMSGKEAPPPYKVPEMVVNLCADLTERLNHLPTSTDPTFIAQLSSLVAWFQHRFVVIHPFVDYNGRTARMLTVFLLLLLGLPAVEIEADRGYARKRYIEAMQEADRGNPKFLEDIIGKAISKRLEQVGFKEENG